MAATNDEFQFLLEDYKQKIGYLTAHFTRMWTRFNYFVTIQSALIGGQVAFGDGKFTLELALLSLGLSGVWYAMGAEDRYLVQVYRKQVFAAGAKLAKTAWNDAVAYTSVGDIQAASKDVPMGPSGWRNEAISTTRLAALIPLLVALLWGAVVLAKIAAR